MRQSVVKPHGPLPVQSLDDVRPTAVKVTDAHPMRRFSDVVKDGLRDHYGSLKCAAAEVHIDQSQLNRELEKLDRLNACDADAKARVAHTIADAFGDQDPKARQRRLVREIRQRLDELSEGM